MRIIAAAFKAWLGILALSLATTALGQSAGTASSSGASHVQVQRSTTKPAIRLLPQQTGLAGTCGGSAFDVNTFIEVDTSASADVKVTAPGVGLIEEFTDETGANIGPYDAVYPKFHILAFGGGLAPNTVMTVTITTYSGPALSGKVTQTSSLAFNCTTGAVVFALAFPAGPSQGIPTLSDAALALSAVLLAMLGAVALRRRKARC